MSCFMGQNPTVPVYRGEIQTRNLGMPVEAWSPDGKRVCVSECVFRVAELLRCYCCVSLFRQNSIKGFAEQSILTYLYLVAPVCARAWMCLYAFSNLRLAIAEQLRESALFVNYEHDEVVGYSMALLMHYTEVVLC